MKAFFGTRMIEESSVQEHGAMMLFLVQKLKDLQIDFERKEKYINNWNMNGLDKSFMC
ncbi:UNVERIFIED_CONTAM: hypothetical protein Sradi_5761200 [Sesamum radiatum]|uniref:Uncharacterized protein n=1 Tax=Sesamum radiatum TaxID=300843 RepID=A0AAW2L2T5_SESRA